MITSAAFAGKSYAVLGLARSGAATVRALIHSGATVTAWDNDEGLRDALTHELPGLVMGDPAVIDLAGFDALVVSPGVPLNTHTAASRARAAHVPIIGDIELFALARAKLPPHRVIGITGTNGKSTTTALIHHLLETAGVPSMMGGNIGLPILSQAALPSGGVYVLELSSYQIDLTHSLACDVAVLTNVTPDHLDRYDGDFLAYAASKARLFSMQQADQTAVIACDDDVCRQIASRVNHRLLRVHAADVDPADQQHWSSLQGPHNAQNAACAIAVARSCGLDDAAIDKGLRSFAGLPHRMERVAVINDVLFINDSKATNPASAAPALAAFTPSPRPRIHWILGGKAKGDTLDECGAWLGHIAHAYTIGDAGPMFARLLAGNVPVSEAGTINTAVRLAAQSAQAGDVVLLSPACASFDQFRDFEARGQAFRDAVAQILPDVQREAS